MSALSFSVFKHPFTLIYAGGGPMRGCLLLTGLQRIAIVVESKGVMVGEVGACNGDGLGIDLGVQALELARMTFKCARVGGDLGSVLVLHDAKFERVLVARAGGAAAAMSSRRAYMLLSLCGLGMALVCGARINRQIFFQE